MSVAACSSKRSRRTGPFLRGDAVTGATGYQIEYGTSTGVYTTTVDIGANPYYELARLNLPAGVTHYVVMRAYNEDEVVDDATPEIELLDGAQIA